MNIGLTSRRLSKPVIALVCAILVWGSLHSLVRAQGTAGQAGEFLRFGVNARALAMGRAFTAVADNANAVYWNPAGLYNVIQEGVSFTLMYSKLFEGADYHFGALAVPIELFFPTSSGSALRNELRHWNLGVGYLLFGSDGYEVRTAENQLTGESFSDQQTAIFFTLTRSFSLGEHQFGVGSSVKWLSHDLFGSRAKAMALDIGVKYQPPQEWVSLGLVIRNFNGPDFGFEGGGEDRIPVSARGGLVFQPQTGDRFLDAILLSADYLLIGPGKRSHEWFLGGEYNFSRALDWPLRLRFGYNATGRLTFGFSLDLPNNPFSPSASQMLPRIDWAYQSGAANELGSLAQQFSMDFSYTPFTSERWYTRGLEKFMQGRYDLAKEDFKRAVSSKNPNKTLFPQLALLRLGDIQLQNAKDRKSALGQAMVYYRQAFPELLRAGTQLPDMEQNRKSLLYFVQGLIANHDLDHALETLRSSSSWYTNSPDGDQFSFLEIWTLMRMGRYDEAQQLALQHSECQTCEFLAALILLKKGEYEQASRRFAQFIQRGEGGLSPEMLILPFSDHWLIDDAFYLQSFADMKRGAGTNIRLNLANIQRFFPFSDILSILKENGEYDSLLDESSTSPVQSLDVEFYWKYLGIDSGA